MIEPALRWPALTLVETARPATAAAPADRSTRRCGCARASAPARTRPPRPRSRPTWSASWPPARSTRGSGVATNSSRTPISAFIASCAGPSAPSAVDVSSLMLEAKAAYVEKHGLPPGDWIFSRHRALGAAGQPVSDHDQLPAVAAPVALAARRCSASRGTGSCPGCAARRSRAGPPRSGLNKPRPAVARPARSSTSSTSYANYYDQELAEAVVAVLHQAEVNVYVPHRQRGSGMAALIVGDVDHARDQALANLPRPGQRGPRRLHRRLFRADRRSHAPRKNTSS